jgi:hypothetical protein
MVSIYTVRIETESGPIEKDFPSRERAELFACFAADHGLEATVIHQDTDAATHNRHPTSPSRDVHLERRDG